MRSPSQRENNRRGEGRTLLALVVELDCLAQCHDGTRVDTERPENGGLQFRGRVVLLAPNVPVLGLHAPGSGGVFDRECVRRGVAGNVVGRPGHVIIGSWIASLSFNLVFRVSCSRASTTRTPRRFPRAFSPPPSAKPSIGDAKIPSGRCRLAWPAAPSK